MNLLVQSFLLVYAGLSPIANPVGGADLSCRDAQLRRAPRARRAHQAADPARPAV